MRDIFKAVLHVLKEGCSWRSLPHDYPGFRLVYYHYRIGRDQVDKASGQPLLKLALKKQVAAARWRDRGKAEPTLLILDSQSVKNTGMVEEKG